MGKSKDLATLKSGLSIDGTLTTTSTNTNHTSNSYNILRVQTDKDDTGAADGILQFTNGSSNTVKGEIRYDASESMFEFGHGDNQGHIRIDSSGRVTKPSQPAFFARHTTASAYNNQYVDGWNSITFNIGNHFVGSTGIFTAPVAGIYQVNAMIGNNYAQGDGAYKIYKNNTLVNGFVFDPFSNQTTWATNVLCGILQCAANDTVRIYCAGAGYPDNADWTSWSMYLLG